MKFEILTNPYHFHIKYRLESTKKTLGYAQTKQIKIFKICQFGHFWPFLAIFGISPLKNIGFFIFFYTAANFTLMCLRNDKNNFGTRRLRKCYWFSKFQVERFFTIFGPFLAVLGIFPPKYVGIFYFFNSIVFQRTIVVQANKKLHRYCILHTAQILHSYLFDMHEPQNQQKKSWE